MKTHKPSSTLPQRRPSAASRGYDRDWQRLRLMKLANDPLCECEYCAATNRVMAAEVVDHIIPIKEQPALRLEWSNLRSMSKACHDRHTLGRGRVVWGCDENGIPRDPSHEWNQKSPATEDAGTDWGVIYTPSGNWGSR